MKWLFPKEMRREDRERLSQKYAGIAFAAMAALVFLFVLAFLGGADRWFSAREQPLFGPVSTEVLAEIETAQASLDAEFERLQVLLASQSSALTQLEALDALVERQLQLEAQYPEVYAQVRVASRLSEMRDLRDPLAAEPRYQDSLRAEQVAQRAEREGDLVVALAAWQEARRLQREINDVFDRSPRRDIVRDALLSENVRRLEMAPQLAEVDAIIAAAAAAQADQAWPEALAALDRAIALQGEINRRAQGSRFADPARLSTLQRSRQEVGEEIAFLEVRTLETEARVASEAGQSAVAAERLRKALNLMEAHRDAMGGLTPRHEAERERLAIAQQSAASATLVANLEQEMRQIEADLLRAELGPARSRVAQALRYAQRLDNDFPLAEARDSVLLARLRYMRAMGEAWADVWERLDRSLQPIPGTPFAMADREVSQSFYALVTGETPAGGDPGEQPVYSLRWDQAELFCERVGWLTGRTVRLPTQAELNAALGDPPLEVIVARAWHSGNARQEVQPVGRLDPIHGGFHDLLGNVAEWTSDAGATASERMVWGGSVRDNPVRLNRVPVESRLERNPSSLIGFRFVVEGWSNGD